jgi:endonuclease/exonuclease/phosphatase family metal-dependent hydrolase
MVPFSWRAVILPLLSLFIIALWFPQPLQAAQGYGEDCSVFKPCGEGLSCDPFTFRCYHKPRREGEPCMAGFVCAEGLICEAGSQKCRAPGKIGDPCYPTRPCGDGLSCQPGVFRCYHVPRQKGEPCCAGYECGVGLQCDGTTFICREPGKEGDPCHLTRQCGPGLKCEAGSNKCKPVQPDLVVKINMDCGSHLAKLGHTLSLFAYNLFLIFPSNHTDSNLSRAIEIPIWIKQNGSQYDVVVFSEAWLHPGTVAIGMGLAGFCNHVYDKREMNGSGLAIYSKYPIEDYDFLNFGAYSAGADSLADKAVLYAKINKGGRWFHVFGTHTNAEVDQFETRVQQYRIIRNFIKSKVILKDELVLIAGDLNEDKVYQADKYDTMLNEVWAEDIPLDPLEGLYSYDGKENILASSNDREALDHVLYVTDPDISATVILPGSSCKYIKPKADYLDFINRDLSDHYAIGCTINWDSLTSIADSKNFLQERLLEPNKIDLTKIPLDDAILMGDHKAGRRVIVFTDPD